MSDFKDQLETLRREFDASFAAPPPPPAATQVDLLLVRIGSSRLALRIDQLRGLFGRRKVAPLPGSRPELLGVAGIRGRLVAVYDLAALLGLAETGLGRWLVLSEGDDGLGFAIPEVDGHVKVDREAIVPSPDAEHGHVPEVVRVGGMVHGVVRIPSVLVTVRGLAGRTQGKE